MSKEAFIDTETTGIDPMKHGLFMIGGIIRIDGQIKEEFKFCCDVFAEDEFAEEAMKKHGYTPEDISKFPDPFNILLSFVTLLGQYVDKYNKQDKYHFIGYGAEFDNKFLRRWFESIGDQYFGSWFWHPWIDVMSLAAEHLKRDRHKMPNFQLDTVAKQLKIKMDDKQTHDALYDARLTMQVYDRIVNPLPENLQEMADGTFKYRLRK